jgi:hypothetical protein
MDPRQRAGASGAGPRRLSARDEALARVSRWKRAIAVTAVVTFGALLGLVGVAGARGSTTPSTAASVSGRSSDGGQQTAPRRAPDDGFFGSDDQDGGFGFGFGDGGAQGPSFGRSGAS